MYALQATMFGDGEPAVDRDVPIERIQLDETSWVDVGRGWLNGADTLFEHLVATVPWKQGRRWMYEKYIDEPRLSKWYRSSETAPHPSVRFMQRVLDAKYRVTFDGVGLNYYRDGRDSVGFHADTELRYIDDTKVAIVTVGSQRPFLVRPKRGGESIDIQPAGGDLLVMGGRCQADWQHSVPKSAGGGPRISLSWRWTAKRGAPAKPWDPYRHFSK